MAATASSDARREALVLSFLDVPALTLPFAGSARGVSSASRAAARCGGINTISPALHAGVLLKFEG